MSLFSGIKFSSDTAKTLAAELKASECAAGVPSSAPAAAAAAPVVNPLLAGPSKGAPASSASLQFAPRRPKPAASRPGPPSSHHVNVHSTPTVSALVEAAPVLIVPPRSEAHAPKEQQVVLGGDGQPVVRAPATTLKEVQRKRKKKRKRQQQVFHAFDPEEEYDPNRPNDLGEYQRYREQVRAERRAAYMESKRKRAAGVYDSDSSEYSDDAAPRRDAPVMFAPPKSYGEPTRAPSPPPRREDPPPPAETGEDAYARRLAMSTQTGDDAYARRAALSARPPASSAAPSFRPPVASAPPFRPPVPSPSFRLPDPSPSFRPPVPAPSFRRPEGVPSFRPPQPAPSFRSAEPPAAPAFRPPPAQLLFNAPTAPPVFRPPPSHLLSTAPPPPPPPSQPASSVDYQKQLQEKMLAAQAIAAKLMPQRPAPADTGSGTFAEKMFRRWGHTEGKGLGVREDGITHALTAEHVLPTVDTSKMSKRALAKHRAAVANAKTRKWVQAPSARGRIVNANEEVRSREDLERFGEVSRVVCLTGVVEDPEEIPEDLTDRIGDECSNHGIVERVVLHLVEPPPPNPQDGLRVFAVFSGVAGAWRATHELDGRTLAGENIRARYFDEARFDSGDRDAPF